MTPSEILEKMNEMQRGNDELVFGRRGSRHLSAAAAPEGRRLRSSFDAFDLVNNAITSGVKQAKLDTNKILNSVKQNSN